MTINFYLNTGNVSDDKSIYVYIRGLIKGKTFVYNTGEKINPKFWDKDKQRAKNTKAFPAHPELNSKIGEIQRSIEKHLKEAETFALSKSETLSKATVITAIEKGLNKNVGTEKAIFDALAEYLTMRNGEVSANFIKSMENLQMHLLEFQGEKKYKITFGTIDLNFYNKFRAYQREIKGNVNTTVNQIINVLKHFLNWCADMGYNTNKEYKKFKNYKNQSSETPLPCLTNDELLSLLNLDLSLHPKLSNVRDVFCFACFTGVRYSDIKNIQWADIKDYIWTLTTIKTNTTLEIDINYYSDLILNRHIGEARPLKILSLSRIDTLIKKVCGMAGITEPTKVSYYIGSGRSDEIYPKNELIAMHTARRTFITLSLEKGMLPKEIMQQTGHKDITMLNRYFIIDKKKKKESIHRAWGNPELKLISKHQPN